MQARDSVLPGPHKTGQAANLATTRGGKNEQNTPDGLDPGLETA